MPLSWMLAQNTHQQGNSMAGTVFLVVILLITLITLMGVWRTFTKAGAPGWASLVPFYNFVVLCRMAGKPAWWLALLLLPFVGIVFGIIVMINVARNFGKGTGFAFGLILLPFPFFPMLGFSNAQFRFAEGSVQPTDDEEEDLEERFSDVTEPTGSGRPI